ncbi:hypothetical protein [Caldimonas brevitalea]|uniref:hypothetical protein n=1 Tax=Caldimonas brevitalea TaxID=413882 RepID=UPI0012F84306|nr:hypothetical protein [Caldimonas brevitalea]
MIREIDAMVQTDEQDVYAFVVREATPSRIERLYRSDAVHRLSTDRLQNGLIFAGRGSLLRFDAPSDIVKRVERWFSYGIQAARRDKRLWTSHVHLYGPFPGWDDEPAAFLTLWNCMPQQAWLYPDRSPFDPTISARYTGLVAGSSAERDFGQCVRERSGRIAAFNAAQMVRDATERQQMAARMEPFLTRHFARHLASRGCKGTGPDDCVLIALLWSSLAPSDPRLASALQQLEPEIQPGSRLSTGLGIEASDSREDRRLRLVKGLRQAAFLRAKLISLTSAPAAWPAGTLPDALRQLARLQTELVLARDDAQRSWSDFDLAHANEPINPWPVLGTVVESHAGLVALGEQITALEVPSDCRHHGPWLQHLPTSLLTSIAVKGWTAGRPSQCLQPDWDWLRRDSGAEAGQLRAALVALLGGPSGWAHEEILSGLTAQATLCFNDSVGDAPAHVLVLCRAWVSQPQKMHERPSADGRRATHPETFVRLQLPGFPSTRSAQPPDAPQEHDAWLKDLLGRLGAPDPDMAMVVNALRNSSGQVITIQGWRSRDGQQQVIELQLMPVNNGAGLHAAAPSWPYGGDRLLLLLSSGRLKPVGVPARFAYQYDSGAITKVTDMDHDQRPEVWLTGPFGECDDPDSVPGISCAVEARHMGEIWADTLTYFKASVP